MKSKGIIHEKSPDMFKNELKNLINLEHELCKLADLVDWDNLDEHFGQFFPSKRGNPAIPTRLIAGLFFLKATYNVSDENLPRLWVENVYWQYFCGEQYLQHKFPINPSSMSKWRKRLKKDGTEKLLQESINLGLLTKTIKKQDLSKATVDTTVQEKNITYPTDSKLYARAIDKLSSAAKDNGIQIKQSYKFVAKKALFKAGCYARARQMKRASKERRKLNTYLGRLYRDIQRKSENTAISTNLHVLMKTVERLLSQQKTDKNKLYSLHAPEVECIGKGKVHKKYEFGVKIGVVSTHKSNFVIGVQALPGNPYDGHTLKECLNQVESITGIRPLQTFVDNGYRGHNETDSDVYVARQKRSNKTRALKIAMKRRNAIEPLIGHMKSDGNLDRNFLKGTNGDQINAIMNGVGYNIRVILKKLRFLWSYVYHAEFQIYSYGNLGTY